MKIAVLNSNGVQTNRNGKIKYYYLVEDAYDFNNNSATDVTTIENLKLFNDLLRLDYVDYRDSLISYVGGVTFSNLSNDEKLILTKNFAVDKSDRDTVSTSDEQKDYAIDVQSLIDKANIKKSYDSYSDTIANNSGVPEFTNSTSSSVFGSYVAEVSSDGETTTNDREEWQTKVSLITTSIPTGKYKISWYAEQKGSTKYDFESRVVLDDSTDYLMETNIENKDGNNWYSISGFKYVNLSEGIHTVDFEFKPELYTLIRIRNVRLDIIRIS